MSEHIEQPCYAELLDTVRGIKRYANAARPYCPLHLGTNLMELARDAEDILLRAEVVNDEKADAYWEREAR